MAAPRAELRWMTTVSFAGRSLRVELYEDGTGLCTCRDEDCEHIRYAKRLRDQPATVAIEQLRDSYVLGGCVFSDAAKAEWANGAYRLVVEALNEQGRADDSRMWRLHRDQDTRTRDELVTEAVRQFQTPGGPGTQLGDRTWGTHGKSNPADISTAHLGRGSTYDPAIHKEP